MLAQDYENFEVIVVDDCSTDETLEILNDLAAENPRLRVVRGKELPPDWVPGKAFPLAQAKEQARGEWLLNADADLIFHPAALRSAMRFLEQHQCDVLSIEIRKECLSFWEKLGVPIVDFATMLGIVLGGVNDPSNRRAYSTGGFLLIRRSALDSIGGFASIKDQVNDGIALECLLKQAGHRFLAAEAPELVYTRAYASIRELWEGWSKGMVAFRKKIIFLVPLALPILLFTVFPSAMLLGAFIMLASGNQPGSLLLLLAALSSNAAMIATHLMIFHQARIKLRYALLSPLAYTTFLVVWLGAAYSMLLGRGLEWKGRHLCA